MQDERIIVGLDIGTTKVCAVVGRLDSFGKIEVMGMGKAISEGVKDGTVSNINKTVDAIDAAVRQAEENAKIEIGVVNVGIAGTHIKSSEHHGSITRKSAEDEITYDDVNRLTNDMYRIVTEPGSEIIHVIPQQYTVDYEDNIKDPVGMSGVKLEGNFHIITSHSNAIKNIHKCAERTKMDIEHLVLEPLASSLAVLSEEEKEAGVVMVDIGGGTTDVAVYYDGVIRHTAIIPFGGNIITNDIKHGCSVMQNQAELLKVKFGRALSSDASEREVISIPGLRNRSPKEISMKNLAYIIEARMEEIIELVVVEIQKSGYSNRLAGGIVLTGGASQLRNIKELFELKTGMDTRIGHPNEYLGKTKADEVKSPAFATAIGLVLAGFQQMAQKEVQQAKPEKAASTKKPKSSQQVDLFSAFMKKTKEFLIDDFDDRSGF